MTTAARQEEELADASADTLRESVRNSSLAIALVDLQAQRFIEFSPRAAALLGWEPVDLRDADVVAISEQPDATRRALQLIADGVLDSYQARRAVRGGDGAVANLAVSVRVVPRRSDRTEALVIVVPVGEHGNATAPLAPADRVMELEERMRRIAREIQAAGMMTELGRLPGPETVPGLEDLSPRQWEVVTRLYRGERVPAIARALYLSPSTVRNHLATIFRKVGVHSQTELLDLLRQHA